jgi:hypothetical protein
MRASDVHFGLKRLITLTAPEVDGFDLGDPLKTEVQLDRIGDLSPTAILRIGDNRLWKVAGVSQRDETELDDLLSVNPARISWVVGFSPKTPPYQQLTIEIHEFSEKWIASYHAETMIVGVEEATAREIAQRFVQETATSDQIIEWIRRQTLVTCSDIPGEMRTRAFLSAGSIKTKGQTSNSFQLLGLKIVLNVVRGDNNRYIVTGVSKPRRTNQEAVAHIALFDGPIDFEDYSFIADPSRAGGKTTPDTSIAEGDSYLNIWSEYNKIERAKIQDKADKFGFVPYEKRDILGNGDCKFFVNRDELDKFHEFLEENETFEARARMGDTPFIGRLVRNEEGDFAVVLRPINDESNDQPPAKGKLTVSLKGDEKRLQRREQAQEIIRLAAGPLPQLRYLIEGQPPPYIIERKTRRLRQTDIIKAFGADPPNESQKRALEITFATPDIAVIQGPPGTGKTKVISALCNLLADTEKENYEPIPARFLLTSYQHDAVENVAVKTEVFGIPTIKFGRRGRTDRQESLDLDIVIKKWTEKARNGIREELASVVLQ